MPVGTIKCQVCAIWKATRTSSLGPSPWITENLFVVEVELIGPFDPATMLGGKYSLTIRYLQTMYSEVKIQRTNLMWRECWLPHSLGRIRWTWGSRSSGLTMVENLTTSLVWVGSMVRVLLQNSRFCTIISRMVQLKGKIEMGLTWGRICSMTAALGRNSGATNSCGLHGSWILFQKKQPEPSCCMNVFMAKNHNSTRFVFLALLLFWWHWRRQGSKIGLLKARSLEV